MKFIDPFVMQLFIVPIIVIGFGVLASFMTKKVFFGPLITLIMNLLYETCYSKYYYPEHDISFTSWNIIFPLISLVFSWIVVFESKNRDKPKN